MIIIYCKKYVRYDSKALHVEFIKKVDPIIPSYASEEDFFQPKLALESKVDAANRIRTCAGRPQEISNLSP